MTICAMGMSLMAGDDPFPDGVYGRRVVEVVDGSSECVGGVAEVSEDFGVAHSAEQAADFSGAVAVVYG